MCHGFQWDISYVLPILRELCEDEVDGEVHGNAGSSALTGAMYIPNIYLSMQRKSVDEFFISNGYITAQDCLAMGVLESQMGDYVQKTNVRSMCSEMHDVVAIHFAPISLAPLLYSHQPLYSQIASS